MNTIRFASLTGLGLLLFCAVARADDAERNLYELFEDYDAWYRAEFPEEAMQRGDYSHADRITDQGLAAIERRHQARMAFAERLHGLPRAKLNAEDRLNYDLFELMITRAIEGHRFRAFLWPIGGRFGPQQSIPQMHERVRFATLSDYRNYLKRIEQQPRAIEDIIERLRVGVSEGRTPPRVTLAGVPDQFRALLEEGGLERLREPLAKFPDAIGPEQRKELLERFEKTSFPALRNALDRLHAYFVNDYLPRCRESIAASDLPDGEAYYAYQLRVMTTTDLSAREIHELGLREVDRIRSEMMEVIRRSDFLEKVPAARELSDDALFARFIQYLREDPRFYHTSAADLLIGYRDICKRIDAHLPSLFRTLPRLTYGVREIPAFMAPNQTTAYYSPGDLANGQPGYFYANTYALDQRPKYEMVALALHESVPGHHFQIAIAQELPDAPEFRKHMWVTAFGEGWALYAERLGIEMGLYEDPYSDFGRLLYEMWRACRLVVDPGMHALGWTREQAIDFMLSNTALSKLNITNEVDRYIAWPGQATAYKIGELRIRALRQRAEDALGERFNLRDFHDAVLTAGPLPLSVLEQRIDAWIAAQQERE
ncbi:MAG: DUF885 domain-containing protein [Planctomycetota bacterium]|nr:MAG: DUF885 domain-containing protein [Planctomycetota bacterium]